MKKRAVSLLLAVLLTVLWHPVTAGAGGSMQNFKSVRQYRDGQFIDVSDQWFAPYVKKCYEYGLLSGKSETAFEPQSNLTIAEAIKLAAGLHSIYYENTIPPNTSSRAPWFGPYVNYALENRIITSSYPNYNANATRSDMAVIFANALPDEALLPINKIGDDFIPDVSMSYSYGPAVYKLYSAGVLTGSDSAGTFYPGRTITRDAVAAIVARMADPSLRQTLSLQAKELSPVELSAKCSTAVFRVDIFDETGYLSRSCSGFFISSDGLAVTSASVAEHASAARIVTTGGKTYEIAGVYDYNTTSDLALVKVEGDGFPYLDIGNSDTVALGSSIYAVGFPAGYAQTMTRGIITNLKFIISDTDSFMFDANISPGCSGGPLIDTSGHVVGVIRGILTTNEDGELDDSQNVNVAVPVNLLSGFETSKIVPLSELNPFGPYRVTSSPSSVVIKKGQSAAVVIGVTQPNQQDWMLYYESQDESVVTCKWGSGLSGKNVTLQLQGLRAGTATVEVLLLKESDWSYLATTYITVTVVNAEPTLPTYEGFYPVIDFGAYANVPLFDTFTSEEVNSFFYKAEDVRLSPQTVFSVYPEHLISVGCDYLGTVETQNGFPLMVFDYAPKKFRVLFGVENHDDVLCYVVAIIPY